ncbi:MAG TPA: aminotransferase class V-fold PLP-dependent enzyme [Steroidobacteraceae bacterium]|nr:aminotransferase class V-fold PLP-dependent enzyme [Steroidobacteraceae bacterium]
MTPLKAQSRGTPVLLCPGPVMLSAGVKGALSQCEIGHRDATFSEVLARLRRNAALVLGATEAHSVVFLTGPSTSGIESAMSSLFPAEATVVVPVNGTFGHRLLDILRVHGLRCAPVEFGFGQPFDLSRLEAILATQAGPGGLVLAMTHHETSAGILNPVAEACALARRAGAVTFVDATSSAGAEELDVTRMGIDVCATASGKCLHAAPGVAVVCFRRELLDSPHLPRPRSFALDLRRHHAQIESSRQTPFTPAVPLFLALDRALEELLRGGGTTERRRQYQRRRAYLADGLRRLGLPLLPLPPASEACSILTIGVPPSLGFDAFYRAVRERGYLIYGAKAPLAPKYFQAAVMGELLEEDLAGFLGALGSLLPAGATPARAASA